MNQRVLYETHAHTPLCKHAVGDPEDYADVARQRGLRGLIVTCHNPLPDGHSPNVRMSASQLDEYVDLVARARESRIDHVDVRLGLEADYLPEYVPWLEAQLARADFHFVLGSAHPQTAEYRALYHAEDPIRSQHNYFQLLAEAAETELFDSISHPDLIKNFTRAAWDPAGVMDEIRRALDRIADTGVCMELNTSGAYKTVPQMNPFPEMLCEMRQRGIPVTLGSDAHQPERVADRFVEALELLESCGYSRLCYFLDRQRREVSISDALESLVNASS